jgi:hypothetical protein
MINNKNKLVIVVWCLVVFIVVFGIFYYSIYHFAKTKNTPVATRQIPNDVSTTTAKYVYKNITFNIISHSNEGLYPTQLEIYQNDKLVITQDAIGVDIFPLGSPCPWDDTIKNCGSSDPAFGVDINGNGEKDFVFADLSGGSANEIYFYIFELSKNGTITKIADIDTYGGATFKDLTGNRHLDVELGDSIWGCWNSACAFSPSPSVILSWNSTKQKYLPNISLIRKAIPSQNDIMAEVNYFKDNPSGCTDDNPYHAIGGVTCRMPWNYALDLIYSGNAVSAKSYLNLVWSIASSTLEHSEHGSFSSEKDLENQLLSNLKSSEYYTTILSLNGGKIF